MRISIWIYTDNSDSRERLDFILKDGECLLQVSAFPGYGTRRWFLCQSLPPGLQKETVRWLETSGQIQPPFSPGGVYFSRARVDGSPPQVQELAFFRNNNTDLAKWLSDLRCAVARPEFAVDKLPEWVDSNSALKKQLGFR